MGNFIAKRWSYIDDAGIWAHQLSATVAAGNLLPIGAGRDTGVLNAQSPTIAVGEVGGAFPALTVAAMWDLAQPTADPVELGTILNMLGSSATSIDNDVIVGSVTLQNNSIIAVIWDATNPTNAPIQLSTITNQANATATDILGNNVVGWATNSSESFALVWDASAPSNAPVTLGIGTGDSAEAVFDTSVVGTDTSGSAVLWDLSNPANAAIVLGASVDQQASWAKAGFGSAIIGLSQNTSFVGQAVLWSLAAPTDPPIVLGLTAGMTETYASDISADAIVGSITDGSTVFGCLWDLANPTADPVLIPGYQARAESILGNSIVGSASPTDGGEAFPATWDSTSLGVFVSVGSGPDYMNSLYLTTNALAETEFQYLSADGDATQAFVSALP